MNTLNVILNMGFLPVCGIVTALMILTAGIFLGMYKIGCELQHYEMQNEINMVSFSLGIFIFLFIGIVFPAVIITLILVCCLK